MLILIFILMFLFLVLFSAASLHDELGVILFSLIVLVTLIAWVLISYCNLPQVGTETVQIQNLELENGATQQVFWHNNQKSNVPGSYFYPPDRFEVEAQKYEGWSWGIYWDEEFTYTVIEKESK